MKKAILIGILAAMAFTACSNTNQVVKGSKEEKVEVVEENPLLTKTIYFEQGDWFINLHERGSVIGGTKVEGNNNRWFAKYTLEGDELTIEWAPGYPVTVNIKADGDRFTTDIWGNGELRDRVPLPELRGAEERVFEVEDGIFAKDTVSDRDIYEFIETMTVEEKIGQMLTVGVLGDEALKPEHEQFITEKSIGGVILYSRNILSHNHAVEFINDLKENNAENSNIPLLVATDNEGAFKVQFPRNLPNGPVNKSIPSEVGSEMNYEIGRVNGEFLTDIGVNMNYGTMADVDFGDGTVGMMVARSYSSDPNVVAEYAISYSEGNKDEGVVPVYKHFPGHGKSVDDSHFTLPVLKLTKEEWKDELLPFQIAIDQDSAEAIMTAHIILENIDKDNPATLSKMILTDVLREEMGFEGVIITDDMEMNAIKEYYPFDEAVIRTVEAGTDIVLVCHTLKNQKIAQQALVDAVASGRLTEERIDESVFRILKLKKSNNYRDKTNAHIDIDEYREKFTSFYTDLGILN